MPERKQRVVLVRHTPEPEALTALGARLCYAGGDVDGLMNRGGKGPAGVCGARDGHGA